MKRIFQEKPTFLYFVGTDLGMTQNVFRN